MASSRLTAQPNLLLAWRRITTGRNVQYKRFFRQLYEAYEHGYKSNIERMARRLAGHWQPEPIVRVYLPKPSGLQRPLTLLGLEDQILLQAIANVFATRLRHRRAAVEGSVVFSNLLSDSGNPSFFLQDWQKTYSNFRDRCANYFHSGQRWIATFDLAAFYDTISHELLIDTVSPRGGDIETWSVVKTWLSRWNSTASSTNYGHGIPQGPIASDFLAECFLLPVDEALVSANISYVRYVDDIRLFGTTLLEVQRAAVQLEIHCRERGLIPQGGKFRIQQAASVEEAIGGMPSVIPPDQTDVEEQPTLTRNEAEQAFRDATSGRPLRIHDRTKARYVLFRAPRSPKLLDRALRLLPRHPEQTDALCAFLRLYGQRRNVQRTVESILRNGTPYDYVRGEMWLLLADSCHPSRLLVLRPLALLDLGRNSWHLQLGAARFLLRCQQGGSPSCIGRLRKLSPLMKALLVPYLPRAAFVAGGYVAGLLRHEAPAPGMMLGPVLVQQRQSHRDLGVQVREMHPLVQNVFRGLALIQRRQVNDVDPIAEILSSRYGTNGEWYSRRLLGIEYRHCLQLALGADSLYALGRSQWLQRQDAFNDALVRQILLKLTAAGRAGGAKTIGKDGQLINYGTLLESQGPFAKAHPAVASSLRMVHNRRNALPDAHAYDKKTGVRNRYLTSREQPVMLSALRVAYQGLQQIANSLY